jgi:uncharacterized protein YcfL
MEEFLMRKLVLLGVAVVALFALVACSARDSITANQFETRMTGLGYSVEDVTRHVEMFGLVSYSIAYQDDIFVEFFVFESDRLAIQLFNNMQNMLMVGSRGSASSYRTSSASNFNRISHTSGGQFVFVGRVDSTVLIVATDASNRSVADEVINLIGY